MDEYQQDILFVEVILPLPINKPYTYRLLNEDNELATIGKRILVSVKNKKVYTGIISNITTKAPENFKAEYAISVIDNHPIVSPTQLEFWFWISEYYMSPIGSVMDAALPAAYKMESETYISRNIDVEFDETELDKKEIEILDALQNKEKLKVNEIEISIKSKSSILKLINSLYEKKYIHVFEDLPNDFKPKMVTNIFLNSNLNEQTLNDILNQLETKKKKQHDVLLAAIAMKGKQITKSEFVKQFGLSGSAVETLLKNNVLNIEKQEIDRIKLIQSEDKKYELSLVQNNSLNEILENFKTQNSVLLHAVNNSGKTFIYLELIKKYLENDENVLLLVPDYAVSKNLIKLFEAYFNTQFLTVHQQFSKNEKVEIYEMVRKNKVKLVIGSRSSIFLPFQKIGLIVIDEEHDSIYKQSERNPKYNAKDTALVLAQKYNSKVLLCSATPSVESFYNAINKKYGYVVLNETYQTILPTKILISNIHQEGKDEKMKGIFSDNLYKAMSVLDQRKSQAIIFQNRKGYVPVLECGVCGWIVSCKHCDVSMTYYKYQNQLKCNYCGYHQPIVTSCAVCSSFSMEIKGYGTERIEEELKKYLPNLVISRMDMETSQNRKNALKIIEDFESHKTHVLVGTQMVMKGIDYSNVELSAVINIDQMLQFPDFRAGERCFQLVNQLIGRTANPNKKGLCIIQTKNPEQPILKYIILRKSLEFYQQEISYRDAFLYPPFCRLIKITLKHKERNELDKFSLFYSKLLKKEMGNHVLGPETPHVSYLRNFHLKQILIKIPIERYSKAKNIKKFLTNCFEFSLQNSPVKSFKIEFDVDPG